MSFKSLLGPPPLAVTLVISGNAEAQNLEKYRGLPWYKQPGPATRRLGIPEDANPYKTMNKFIFIADQSTGSQYSTTRPTARWQSRKRLSARTA